MRISWLALAAAALATAQTPTLWIIGDSTVRNGRGDGANGQWGWGEPLADYFDTAKIGYHNRALGGRSSRTFISEGKWSAVTTELKPGDFVILQFGHNDSSPVNDDSRARGTIKGIGDETQEIDNLLTKQHEVVHTFGWYMRQFIAETRAKGAMPIVCSPIPRMSWKNGKIARNSTDYGQWSAEIAQAEHTPFLDLNNLIADRYDTLGPDKVEPLFHGDHTHTSRAGAELNAECVVAALKALKDNPLAPYFSAKAK